MRYSIHPVLVFLAASSVLMLAPNPAASTKVFKWVDAKGRTHFGDKPPESANSVTTIKTKVHSQPNTEPDAEQRRQKQRKLLNALSTERKEREAARVKKRAEKAATQEKCTRTKRSLAILERANLLYTKDKSGDRDYASDDQKLNLIKQLKDNLRKHC